MTVNAASGTTAGTVQNAWNWPSPPDPGDLSRRLAARRAELRLSVSQVAERAAVNRRYLEFLESFPGQPDAGTLRRLAAALRTTPGALLGGGGDAHGDDQVLFETDHLDETLGYGWSVLVRGQAHRVLQPGELRHLRDGCDLRPWPAGEHDLYVRIVPARVTGRRIRSQQGKRQTPSVGAGHAVGPGHQPALVACGNIDSA